MTTTYNYYNTIKSLISKFYDYDIIPPPENSCQIPTLFS